MHFCVGSQFLSVSDDPTKVLRTKTKGIGTDNYRAPEVNAGIHSYDPSAADIWSLGVTLFFLVSLFSNPLVYYMDIWCTYMYVHCMHAIVYDV